VCGVSKLHLASVYLAAVIGWGLCLGASYHLVEALSRLD
jgi:hypothetical protein